MNQAPQVPNRRSLKAVTAVIAGFAALAIIVAAAVLPRLFETAAPPSIGGAFSLVDQTGKTVTDADFRGKMMLIYFGYTYCPDVCPTTLGTVTQAIEQLSPAEQARVVPIFVTVDPERDTVDQIAQYVDAFSPALVGLTGTPEQLAPVLKEFRVYAHKADAKDGNYTVDHSSILYLMGKDGKYLSHFSGEVSAKDLLAALHQQLNR
jgi:protein SCO1/2